MSAEDNLTAQTAIDSPDAPASRSVSRRHLLMGGALLAVSGLAVARTPKQRYADLSEKQFEALFPRSFGNWHTLPTSELVMPPESELANKLYQHILTRTFVDSNGVAVMFLAAYNSMQLNNVQLHRPEICYYAGGFSIDESKPYQIASQAGMLPARMVVASLGSRKENILYWTRIGEDFPQSWVGQRIAMTKANLEGFMADGLLLRMSSINPDSEQALKDMSRFMTDMMNHVSPAARRVLVGTA